MKVKALLVGVLAVTAATVTAFSVSGAANAAPTGDVQPFIVGGGNATETYSFMVSLQNDAGRHFCGGSLIKADWVVTAAHCVEGSEASEIQVRVGTIDHTTGGQTAKVDKVIAHPKYQGDHDIALLKLSSSVTEAPIALAASAGETGTKTRIIGWGQTCPVKGGCGAPETLQELDTSIVADTECEQGFNEANELCTDNPGDKAGACYGDSGGPQIKKVDGKWELVGATSRAGGQTSDCAVDPSIYTDVTAFKAWIDETIAGGSS
ncbi:Trypsin [Actinokineospora alba]|uniref:Trypsin n=1 Tax=Actinokineospora alba TaxID=504798 RepID=A0A1H0F3X8_9PSEU|nr:serine protease [Actinokineospora alba]TDP69327.1 trypsin [Actinokineospora alba]SDI19171.1 Trypsin [Actinokineospora alba]SDN89256.1 Trypsin [Actinokineospora alba]